MLQQQHQQQEQERPPNDTAVLLKSPSSSSRRGNSNGACKNGHSQVFILICVATIIGIVIGYISYRYVIDPHNSISNSNGNDQGQVLHDATANRNANAKGWIGK
jgi:hypothetical protein